MPCSYMHAQSPTMACEGLAPSTATPCSCGQTPFSPAELRRQTVSSFKQRRCRCATGSRVLTLQRATRGHKNAYSVSAQGGDPFAAAGSRLQNLLSGVGDGEEEVLEAFLSEQAPEFKIGLSLLTAGVITSGALALCWLTGSDPWGGASLSTHSLTAATLGCAACVPLLMLRASMWSREARKRFPVLEEVQRWQAEVHIPVLNNMTPVQMAVLVCCEVLPTTVMTLPAAQGGLTASFQLYARHMRDWGVAVPSMGPALAALAITALLAASARLLEHAVSQQEYEIVASAMENADRYYKVMTNSTASRDSDSAAQAFKAVASQWLQQRQQACLVLAVLTAGEVSFLGLLWRVTDDMAAPLAAAMMLTAVEYAFIKKVIDVGIKKPDC
ncbi:hypothetical protein ABBQ32_005134 [Trebouxia sp. C0010 RCD-2024]